MKKTCSFFILFFLYYTISFADILKSITITGNNRIFKETILEYAKIEKNQNLTIDQLDIIQKNIYKTGFFEKIEIKFNDGVLLIKVVENPLIDFFNIQGENDSERLNKLYDMIKLGSNKIYSEFELKNDLNILKNYYLGKGYSDIEIVPRISKLDNNKVNVLINITKNEITKINNIFFIGDKKISSSELFDVIRSTKKKWWNFLSITTVSNESVLYDKELLKNYYLDLGYYDVQITSANLSYYKENLADITFSINAGELYNFGILQISEGESFLNNNIKSVLDALKSKYLTKQYSLKNKKVFLEKLNATLNKEEIFFVKTFIEEVKDGNKINLFLKINPTQKLYVNKIKVFGNSITEEEVIRRNLLFSEGDSFIDYKKEKSLDYLRATRIFKDVKITTDNVLDQKVDVNVRVTEQPTGSISAGAGYGTDGGSVMFGIKESNFIGKGISFSGDLSIGTQRTIGSLDLIIPDFNYSNKTLYSSFYSTRTNLSNTLYQSNKTGLNLATRYEIFDSIYFKPGLAVDIEKVEVDSTASSYLRSFDGNYSDTIIKYNIEKDSRDRIYGSRDGYILGFSQEYSSFISDIPYIKNTFYGSNYYPVGEKQTLNLKYGVSNISSTNDKSIKLSDRLFIPFANSKGFAPRGFGPKDSNSAEFIGGNNSFYSVASVSFPSLFKDSWKINTVGFVNALNIWGVDNSSINDSNHLRSAYGIGLDWKSPIGPVNVSIAQPIKKADTDKTKFFSFEIGTVF